jgi:hypothetical protein
MIELILSNQHRGLEVKKQPGPTLQIMIDSKTPLETHLERNESQLLGGIRWYLSQLYSAQDAPLRSMSARNGSEAVITANLNSVPATNNL